MSNFNFVYTVLVCMAGAMNLLLTALAYHRRNDFAGARIFVAIAAFSAVYVFGTALGMAGDSLSSLIWWTKVSYLGLPFIAPCSLIMILYFVGFERWVTRLRVALLFAIPVITVALVWTNERHHLFYQRIEALGDGPYPLASVVGGPWYLVQGSLTFLCLAAATVLLLQGWERLKAAYLPQYMVMLIGQLLPMACAFLYLIGAAPPGIDPVPASMSITATLYIWAILSRGMLTAAPIARENLFECLRDGVLVLDLEDRLVDFNQAASEMVDGLGPSSIGRPLAQLFMGAGPEALAYVMEGANPPGETVKDLKWRRAGESGYYQIRSSPVQKRGGQVAGRMIMLIDITERMLLQEGLRRLATIDGLTGTANRAHFMELSRKELERFDSLQHSLSFILLDVDHFKNINDRYGHPCGDAALRHITDICAAHLREGDVLGRYGGEEFVLCLPGIGLLEAARLADAIRLDIRSRPLASSSGPVAITASFGVTEAVTGDTLTELLRQADRALYASKNAGRDRVHLFRESVTLPYDQNDQTVHETPTAAAP
ncbi:diguanylate cyclase [Paenibacillus spiritus]|uniref:Diguanylate cyclase n=1 Tax=Paenibacillus spiritus TaxID=2496557 RepID=A0A5J5GC99_9BACL|nr:histidine kinase N-terminal 7TM domain-containing protein [Paenibacillus spiritus]KAA9005785.1 diguanylate cyclase [Paenibacillus spiritus]